MTATVIIEGKEITAIVDQVGAIIPTHVDGRLIDLKNDTPDGDFVALYDSEIVEAVGDWIEADKYDELIGSLPF